jgi:hypothetical protein
VVPVPGDPDPKRICTSIGERQNLTMRMQVRHLTRLTNAFSKKWENLWAALCLHFAYYSSCRSHRSLRVTPALERGIADHIWTIRELLGQRRLHLSSRSKSAQASVSLACGEIEAGKNEKIGSWSALFWGRPLCQFVNPSSKFVRLTN